MAAEGLRPIAFLGISVAPAHEANEPRLAAQLNLHIYRLLHALLGHGDPDGVFVNGFPAHAIASD
jgi:hypothetical protein